MAHAVTHPPDPILAMDGALEIHQIPDASDNLVWLLICTATREAAVVDGPGCDAVLRWAKGRDVRLRTILNTHTHGDHIGINHALKRRGELSKWRVVGNAESAGAIPGLSEPVKHGDKVQLGALEGQVFLTEGHLDGHISFVFGDALFCGDTLFAGGCGYLFDGPASTMFDSLTLLSALPGDTLVCCAHEYTQDNLRFAWSVEPDNPDLARRIRQVWAIRSQGRSSVPSTIDEERATNPFLRPGSRSIRAAVKEAFPDRALYAPADIFAATRALKDTMAYRELTDADLPLERP